MTARPARRLATAGSLSLALALGAPAAAFADHKGGHDKPGPRPTSSPAAAAQGGSSSQGSSSSSGKGSSTGTSSSGQGSGSSTGSGKGSGKGGGKGSKPERAGKPSPEGKRKAPADPRGNNGTVKIDGAPFDDGRGNDSHVGCTFEVDFYGFDEGDTASITFTAHAPTGAGTLLHSQSGTLISDDAAGGGQDADAELVFSVAEHLSELLAIAPHPKQGWHVKLEVDVDSAPGGAKQKVFWISCPAGTAVSGTSTSAATGGTTTAGSGTTTTTGGGGVTQAAAGSAGVVSARSVERSVEKTFGAGTTTVTGTTTQAAQGAGTVSSRSAAKPSALPFTGAEGLGYLLALGAAAVGVGTAAHRLGRRRASAGA